MSKHIAARIAETIAAVTAVIILMSSRAFAVADPGLGEGSGSPQPQASPGFEVLGMAWQPALAIALTLIAVVGLAMSVRHHRHLAGKHA